MKRFFTNILRFFWSWGFLKFVLVIISLIVLLYAEEDWRGARVWAATKTKWEAQGESFDPKTYFPLAVPDGQNLAALPIFKLSPDPTENGFLVPLKFRQALDESNRGGDLPHISAKPDEIREKIAAAYARAFPGTKVPVDVLSQFETLYPVIPEIHAAAATRPYCRFNQDYVTQPPAVRSLGLITEQIRLSRSLCLHAVIALNENQPQIALDDIKINFRLAEGIGHDPTLVAGLVAIGICAITRQAIEKGLNLHAWNDAQLAELQKELQRLNFLFQFKFTLRGEIITQTIPDTLFFKKTVLKENRGVSMWGLWPSGWLDLDRSRLIDLLFRELKSIDPQQHLVFPENNQEIEREVERTQALPWRLAPWNLFFNMSAPTFENISLHFAVAQASLDEGKIACALERYRLAHGSYPASLDALVPTCIDELPHDLMSGKSYQCRLNRSDTFSLYSVGWNQIDEGGKVVFKQDMPKAINYEQGDWVWPTAQASGSK